MSEPNTPFSPPSPDATQPAAPFASPAETPGPKRGCGKPLAIGCALIAVLVIAGLVVVSKNVGSILTWTFSAMRGELEGRMPEDLNPEVRQRYETAFDAVLTRISEGNPDPTDLQRIQLELTAIARTDPSEPLAEEDLLPLIESLERFAGIDSEEPSSEPGPVEGDEGGSTSGSDPPPEDPIAESGVGS